MLLKNTGKKSRSDWRNYVDDIKIFTRLLIQPPVTLKA